MIKTRIYRYQIKIPLEHTYSLPGLFSWLLRRTSCSFSQRVVRFASYSSVACHIMHTRRISLEMKSITGRRRRRRPAAGRRWSGSCSDFNLSLKLGWLLRQATVRLFVCANIQSFYQQVKTLIQSTTENSYISSFKI